MLVENGTVIREEEQPFALERLSRLFVSPGGEILCLSPKTRTAREIRISPVLIDLSKNG